MYWFIHSFIHLLDGLFFSVFNLQLYISSAGTPLILTDMKLWLRWLANKSLSILIFMYWALQNLLPLPLGLFQSAAPWNRLTFLCIRQADLGMAAKQEGRFSVSDLAGHCELSLSPRFLQHCYDLAKTSFGSGMSSLSWCFAPPFSVPYSRGRDHLRLHFPSTSYSQEETSHLQGIDDFGLLGKGSREGCNDWFSVVVDSRDGVRWGVWFEELFSQLFSVRSLIVWSHPTMKQWSTTSWFMLAAMQACYPKGSATAMEVTPIFPCVPKCWWAGLSVERWVCETLSIRRAPVLAPAASLLQSCMP